MYVEKGLVTSFVIYFDVSSQDSPSEIKTSLEVGSNTAEIQTEYLPNTRRQRIQE